MSSSNGAREFPVETDFQRKARRPGGVTRNQAVGGAQAQIETLKDEFTDWVKDGLKRLQSSIQLAETQPPMPRHRGCFSQQLRAARYRHHDGYELVTFVANLLCEVLDNIRNGTDYDKVLIRCHLERAAASPDKTLARTSARIRYQSFATDCAGPRSVP
jgi:hypothetical protein